MSDDPTDDPTDESMAEVSRAFGIPLPLVKASVVHFSYAMGLRGGDVIVFSDCVFDPEHVWVTLRGIISHTIKRTNRDYGDGLGGGLDAGLGIEPFMSFDRGFVVRIADVLWAAEAPRGPGEIPMNPRLRGERPP